MNTKWIGDNSWVILLIIAIIVGILINILYGNEVNTTIQSMSMESKLLAMILFVLLAKN